MIFNQFIDECLVYFHIEYYGCAIVVKIILKRVIISIDVILLKTY